MRAKWFLFLSVGVALTLGFTPWANITGHRCTGVRGQAQPIRCGESLQVANCRAHHGEEGRTPGFIFSVELSQSPPGSAVAAAVYMKE